MVTKSRQGTKWGRGGHGFYGTDTEFLFDTSYLSLYCTESSITLSMQPSPGSLTADLGERIKISCSLEPLTYSYSLSLTKQNVPDDWIFLLEILPVDRKMYQDKLTIEHEIEKGEELLLEMMITLVRTNDNLQNLS